MRGAGRGDFRTAHQCLDCVDRREDVPGPALYRCVECFLPDLTCMSCIVLRHKRLPFHRVEVCFYVSTILCSGDVGNFRNGMDLHSRPYP